MSEFSSTRLADMATAIGNNASIGSAVNALSSSGTVAGRGAHRLEAFELLQWMVNNNFTVSYNSVSITSGQTG